MLVTKRLEWFLLNNPESRPLFEQYVHQLGSSLSFTRLEDLFDLMDGYYEEEFKKMPKEELPSCLKQRCHYCCTNQIIDVSQIEIDLIRRYCKQNNIRWNKKEMHRQRALQRMCPDIEEARFFFRRQTDVRCIFLGNDNRCRIYPVRPMACRNFYVYVDDPKKCGGCFETQFFLDMKIEVVHSIFLNLHPVIGQLHSCM